MSKNWLIFVAVFACAWCICESRKYGGGGRTSWSSSSSRRSSSRVATSKPQTQRYATQSHAAPPTPRRAVHQATTPRSAVNVGTTQRYNFRTQATVGHYPQQHYPQQTYPHQSYPQQPHYNINRQPSYSQPSYHQPSYHPSYQRGAGYVPSGGYYTSGYKYKSDHSTRNAVLSGLGGSALGLYLGYKLGSWSSSSNQPGAGNNNLAGGPNYGGNTNNGGAGEELPKYAVVHHYNSQESQIPKNIEMKPNVVAACGNDTNFCTPGTTPLCLANGTVFCVAPLDSTAPCGNLTCINSTITLPCGNETTCNGTQFNTTTISIPCVTNISMVGNFTDNKLSVHAITSDGTNGTDSSDTVVTSSGIVNKFCVTVIAEPLPPPVQLTNAEFMKLVSEDPVANEIESAKTEHLMKKILNIVFF